jgi:C-terminal processing protease CtpA/Prc
MAFPFGSLAGGVADKEGTLRVGDELLSVNGAPLASMSRLEAWNCLKRLPDGEATVVIRQKLDKQGCTSAATSATQQIALELCSSAKSP